MKYTNKQLLQIEKKAKSNKNNLTHITNKSELSAEDKVKLGLCRHFVQFAVAKKMKLKDLSKLMGVALPRLSEITNYKIKKFTVDFLLKQLSILATHDSQIREYLKFFSQAAELPVLTVTKTRRLTQDLKQASL